MKYFFVLVTTESLHPEKKLGNNCRISTTDVSSWETPTNEINDNATDKINFFMVSSF